MITDPSVAGRMPFEDFAKKAIAGGADVIQLRDKKASDEELLRVAEKILSVTRPRGIPLIINDRLEVARLAAADGVHLGQEDASWSEARSLLGESALIGRSTHNQEQALAAQAQGFDYIGVGPVYGTPTKPGAKAVGLDLVRFAAQNLDVPFVAIGGIDESNVRDVLAAGAKTVAVVRAVAGNPDPKKASESLLRHFS